MEKEKIREIEEKIADLKARWPAPFLCARLADRGGFHHPAIYIAEALRLRISVRPPHVNHSGRRFTLAWEGDGTQGVLWMGLGQVRDLRQSAGRAIVAELGWRGGGRQTVELAPAVADLLRRTGADAADLAAGKFNALAACFAPEQVQEQATQLFRQAIQQVKRYFAQLDLPQPELARALLLRQLQRRGRVVLGRGAAATCCSTSGAGVVQASEEPPEQGSLF